MMREFALPHRFIRWTSIAAACVATTLVLYGCDSVGSSDPIHVTPDETQSDPIHVTRPIADTTLYIDNSFTIDLHDYLDRIPDGQSPIAVFIDGSSVVGNLSGGSLTLTTVSSGTSTVRLVVTDRSDDASAELSFQVHVLLCPTELAADEGLYFPNEVGHTWNYDYYKTSGGIAQSTSYSSKTIGNLKWEIINRTDECYYVDLEIKETFEGENTYTYIAGAIPDTTTTFVTWDKILHSRLEGDTLSIEGYTLGVGERLAHWRYPISEPEIILLHYFSGYLPGGGGSYSNDVTLQRNTGLVYYHSSSSDRFSSRSTTMTLLP